MSWHDVMVTQKHQTPNIHLCMYYKTTVKKAMKVVINFDKVLHLVISVVLVSEVFN